MLDKYNSSLMTSKSMYSKMTNLNKKAYQVLFPCGEILLTEDADPSTSVEVHLTGAGLICCWL